MLNTIKYKSVQSIIIRHRQRSVMDNLKIREAKEEDFEDVMNLSVGVYNGLDYLPTIYHTYITEASVDQARRLNYVAYMEEEIVGFFSISFNFDFSNYLLSALRVSSRYRKLGIGMTLLSYYEKFGPRLKSATTQMTSFANFVMSDHLLARVLQSQVVGQSLYFRGVKSLSIVAGRISVSTELQGIKVGASYRGKAEGDLQSVLSGEI